MSDSRLPDSTQTPSSMQAQMIVPIGIVEQRRQAFERRIAEHRNERASILLDRALHMSTVLPRSYPEYLRLVEHHTLLHLPTPLVNFLRDHDNLHHAVVRSSQRAKMAVSSPNMDVITRVAHRILGLRNDYYFSAIRACRAPHEQTAAMDQSQTERVIRECTDALTGEIFRILSRLEVLLPNATADVELENVGPDHDVNHFGRDVSQHTKFLADDMVKPDEPDENDPSIRCCICLDTYNTTTHPGFLVSRCNHIIGKPCLSTWLNSTSCNSNLCPYCRAQLCERRTRRPRHPLSATTAEQHALVDRLHRAMDLLEDVARLFDEIFQTRVTEGQWFDDAMEALNRSLFESGMGFGFVSDGFERVVWRLRRVDWGSGVLVA